MKRLSTVPALLAGAMACLLVVAPLAGCTGKGGHSRGATLHWNGDESIGGGGGEFGLGQTNTKAGDVIAFGAVELCIDGAGSATITNIRFRSEDHIVVKRFAVRLLDFTKGHGLGNARGSILNSGFTEGSSTVTTPCTPHRKEDDASPVTELGIDVVSRSLSEATGKTLVISYRSAHRRSEMTVPLTVKLCASPVTCS